MGATVASSGTQGGLESCEGTASLPSRQQTEDVNKFNPSDARTEHFFLLGYYGVLARGKLDFRLMGCLPCCVYFWVSMSSTNCTRDSVYLSKVLGVVHNLAHNDAWLGTFSCY